jgi:hypothetical protein
MKTNYKKLEQLPRIIGFSGNRLQLIVPDHMTGRELTNWLTTTKNAVSSLFPNKKGGTL